MADTVVGLEIRANAEQAAKTVGNIKQELKQAQRDAVAIGQAFGELSPQAIQAAKRVAELRDTISDTNDRIKLFDPGAKFQAFTGVLNTVAGGFSALTGAAALFGAESEDLQKTLVKVQSALALTQGLNAIADAGDSFKNLGAIAKQALAGIRTGIAATGIGVLVVALGAIVAYWEDIKELVSGVSAEQEALNEAVNANLEAEKAKLNTIGNQDNVLKLQGKSEKEILDIKIKQTQQVIQATKQQIESNKITTAQQIAAANRNAKLLEGLLNIFTFPIRQITKIGIDAINGLITLVNKLPGVNIDVKLNGDEVDNVNGWLAKKVFDADAIAAESADFEKKSLAEIATLENNIAGFQLSQQEKTSAAKTKAVEKEKEEFKALYQSKTDTIDEFRKYEQDLLKEDAERQAEADKKQSDQNALYRTLAAERLTGIASEKQALYDQYQERMKLAEGDAMLQFEVKSNYEKKIADIEKKAADDKKAQDKAVIEAKLQMVSNSLGQISDIIGRETAAGKAFAVAQATIDGYLGVQKALGSLPPPFNFVAAAAVGVAAIANIRKIISTKIPGKGSGGGGSAPSGLGAPPPNIPRPQNTTTQLDQNSLNQIGNATARAFVVESDVSGSQERIRRLNRAARLN